MTTVNDFKEILGAKFMALPGAQKLYGFAPETKFSEYFPAACIESVFLYVFSFGLWLVNSLFNAHRADVSSLLANQKPHTPQWYANMGKAYQHGHELPKDDTGQVVSHVYDTIDPAAQIVKYCVAKEVGRVMVIKVAKYTSSDDPSPQKLSENELTGVKRYFSQVKDGGVVVATISNDPDIMAVEAVVYYNPMLLFPDVDENGEITALRNSEGTDIFRERIQQTIENLPFNGDLRKSAIESSIEDIPGADVVDVTGVFVKGSAGDYQEVVGYTTPDSGYFKLESLKLTAKPYSYGNEI